MIKRLLRLFPYVQELEDKVKIMNGGLELAAKQSANDQTALEDCSRYIEEVEKTNREIKKEAEKYKAIAAYMLTGQRWSYLEDNKIYVQMSEKDMEAYKNYEIKIRAVPPSKVLRIRAVKR